MQKHSHLNCDLLFLYYLEKQTYKQFDFGAIEKWNATPDGMRSITDERTVRIELK